MGVALMLHMFLVMLCGYLGTLSDNVGLLRPFEGRSVVARAV